MNKLIAISLLLLTFFSCNNSSEKIEEKQNIKKAAKLKDIKENDAHASPEALIKTVFEAAKTQQFSLLKNLCDPSGKNDKDTRNICDLNDKNQKSFVESFQKGKIAGEIIIKGKEAEVPITFGKSGSDQETFIVVQRDGKWYLSSF